MDYHLSILLLMQLTLVIHGLDYEPLGSHSAPSVGATVLYGNFPPPFVFFHHFVKAGKPLLMKNVLNETGYEIFKTWTDNYLRDRYGDETIEIEKRKKEQRGQPRSKLKFSKYLELYKQMDIYMVQSASKSMQGEVMVPFTLQCGGFQKVLHDAYVWFSGGDTRSVLHYDMMDNINCLLDGKKSLVLIDKKHKKTVEGDGFVHEGRYSLVDVDTVDVGSFPGVAEAPWAKVDMIKGDCVYIPYKWYHHIRSASGRNLAVNLWFSHLLWFNKTDCDNVNRSNTPHAPLRDFNIPSTNENLRSELFSPFGNLEDVKKDKFLKKSFCKQEDNEQIWKMVNSNNDEKLSWEEIYRVDIDKLVLTVPECVQSMFEPADKATTVSADSPADGKDSGNEDEQPKTENKDSGKSVELDTKQTHLKSKEERSGITVDNPSNGFRDKDMLNNMESDRSVKSELERTAVTEEEIIEQNDKKSETRKDTDTTAHIDTNKSFNLVNTTRKTVHDEF